MKDSVNVAQVPFYAYEEANFRADRAETKAKVTLYACISVTVTLLVGVIYHLRRVNGKNVRHFSKRNEMSD